MLRAFALLTLLILSWAAPISAQTATGSVAVLVDGAVDGRGGVPGVTVAISSMESGSTLAEGYTDQSGRISFVNLPAGGLLMLETSSVSSIPVRRMIHVYPNVETQVTVTLEYLY